MAQDYKHDLGLNKINTSLESLEKNPNRTKEEIEKAKNEYLLIKLIKNYPEDVLKEFEDRFNALSNIELSAATPIIGESINQGEMQKLSEISPKNKKVNNEKLKIALATLALGTGIVIAGCSLTSCSDKEQPVDQEVAEQPMPELEEKVEFTEMSKETKEYADNIVLSMNDAISKGFEVTDTNKEIMAKKFVNYMNIINMNNLTKEQWETIYQDGNITGKDMMYDLFDIETIFEKIITVSENESEAIDFNLYFDETDAGLLNKAESMIIKINTSTGNDRKTAIDEMHKFIIDTLTLTENRMQYSEVALNTFRGVFVNAFDVLSNGKSITDEEEHTIFTVTSNCMGNYDNNLKVEDQTIDSLQSKFEIYMIEKIDKMLNKDLDIEVNPYDSFNEISKYVADNIDLSLYKPAKDYVAYQEKLFLNTDKLGTIKSKNDSGISDGKGGIISSGQLERYGAKDKSQLESAVRAEYEAEAEKNKITTDLSGTVVDQGLLEQYTSQGADDYNYKRGNNKSSIPSLYQNAYQNGWDSAKAIEEATRRNLQQSESTTFIPSNNDNSTIINEQIIEQPYTENVPETLSEPVITIEEQPYIEEFVPVEESNVTESIEEITYTSSITELKKLKDELLNLSGKYTIKETHQKC